jgi:hypothetical protein
MDYSQHLNIFSAICHDGNFAVDVKQIAQLIIDVHLASIAEQPTDHQKRSLQRLICTYFERNVADVNLLEGGFDLTSRLEDLQKMLNDDIGENAEIEED